MAVANRLDFFTGVTSKVSIDDCCTVDCNDPEEPIVCPSCGFLVLAGNTVRSRRYLSENGFGYLVCSDCYEYETQKMRECVEMKDGSRWRKS